MTNTANSIPTESGPMVRLIQVCLELDRLAYKAYSSIKLPSSSALLWTRMAHEEKSHVSFWTRLLDLALNGSVPELFENTDTFVKELEDARDQCSKFGHCDPTSEADAFRIGLRVEFFLLHPVFSELFDFAKRMEWGPSPADTYHNHIAQFLQAMNGSSAATEEMHLLGMALQSIWDQQQRTVELSTMDPLTGILNRRGFFHAAKPLAHMAQRSGATSAVLMGDVDNFKKVNDAHGHEGGDRVLQAVGRILSESRRSSDVVARWGGEEFILFFPSIEPAAAAKVAEAIRRRIETDTQGVIPVTISLGLAFDQLGPDTMKGLLGLTAGADELLYEAKRTGKNKVVARAI